MPKNGPNIANIRARPTTMFMLVLEYKHKACSEQINILCFIPKTHCTTFKTCQTMQNRQIHVVTNGRWRRKDIHGLTRTPYSNFQKMYFFR